MKNGDGPRPILKAKRLSTPRIKTGCRTCRTRRVKCDEARPNCLKCVRSGRKCDGYAISTDVAAIPRPLLQITVYSIPFRVPGSQRERQLLHYFCVRAAKDISGSTSTGFWSRVVLQAIQDDVAVRHALMALSSVHLNVVTLVQPATDNSLEDTLIQYGKALRSLQRRIEQATQQEREVVETALVCSVLFYCFESILGNSKAAMGHLEKGLHLLVTRRNDQSRHQDDTDCMAAVAAMLSKLDMQATLYNYARLPTLCLISADERREGFLGSPHVAFANTDEAQSRLVKLQNWLFQLLQERADASWSDIEISNAALDERILLLEHFVMWERKLCLLMEEKVTTGTSTPNPNNGGFLCEPQTLLIQHQVVQLLLTSRLPTNGEVFGVVPDLVAQKILDLSESTLQIFKETAETTESAQDTSRPRSFSSEMGVVAPLVLLAVKCADNTVRQKALRLLASSRRREGLFDAVTMTKLIHQLEEIKLGREAGMNGLNVQSISDSSLEDWTGDIFDAALDGVDQLSEYLARAEQRREQRRDR